MKRTVEIQQPGKIAIVKHLYRKMTGIQNMKFKKQDKFWLVCDEQGKNGNFVV